MSLAFSNSALGDISSSLSTRAIYSPIANSKAVLLAADMPPFSFLKTIFIRGSVFEYSVKTVRICGDGEASSAMQSSHLE